MRMVMYVANATEALEVNTMAKAEDTRFLDPASGMQSVHEMLDWFSEGECRLLVVRGYGMSTGFNFPHDTVLLLSAAWIEHASGATVDQVLGRVRRGRKI